MKHTATIFKNITSTSTGFYRDLTWILDRIKNGNSKELIGLIRLEGDSGERNKLKMQLPSICFSGTFKNRSVAGLIKHSGLIALDFDKFPDADTMQTWRDTIESDDYTLALFTSPSGNGMKVIVQIPADADDHKAYFDALKEHYDCEYFDIATSDVSRVCYESYDPELIYNPKALIWTTKAEEEFNAEEFKVPVIQMKSESRIIQRLTKWWSSKYGANKGSRNQNMYKFAAALNDFGVDKMEAEQHLRQYESDGFPVSEIQKVIASAYNKTQNFGTKFLEDDVAMAKINKMIRTGKTVATITKEFPKLNSGEIESAIEEVRDALMVEDFWTFNEKGKVVVSPHRFKSYLEQSGIFKYFPEGSQNFVFVDIESNMLLETSSEKIKDRVLTELYERFDIGHKPWDHMAENTKLFKPDFLSMIGTADVKLKSDTVDSCFLYYNNCAVEVTKDSVNKIDYVDLDSFIWKDQVIDRDFDEVTDEVGIYEKFVGLIAGGSEDKINSLKSVIGYLLNSYKNSGNNKAIVLNDETISDTPNGGSGKGLFCNGISHMKRTSTLDGKAFSFDSSFPYQTVAPDTQVLFFDDTKKNFAFERLFSVITEGLTLERKNKQAIFIPVAKSPKIVLSTNYTIGGVGGSFERRKFEIELSSYFGVHHTPLDEFGLMLFDDFSEQEWRMFDSYMIKCEQYFLEHGLVEHEFNNLDLRKFIQKTSAEFKEWSEEDGNLGVNIRMTKAEKYADFQREYKDFDKLSQRKFLSWIQTYAHREKLDYTEGKSNNVRWFKLTKPDTPEQGLEY